MKNKNTKKSRLPVDEIVDLYNNQDYTLIDLGQKYDSSPSTIRTLLKEAGVPIRSRSEAALKKKKVPRKRKQIEAYSFAEEICERYLRGEGKTPLGEDYNCSPNTIAKILKQNGVHLRTIKESLRLRSIRLLNEQIEALKKEHTAICKLYQEGMPMITLQRLYRCQAKVIKGILTVYGVKIRSNSHFSIVYADDKSKIEKMYEEGLSLAAIAKKYDVAPITIHRYFVYHSIPTRNPTNRSTFIKRFADDKERIRQSYVRNRTTIKELAEEYNVSNATMYNYIVHFGFDKERHNVRSQISTA